MPATFSTERVCPYHGRTIRLADCMIVATDTDACLDLERLAGNGEYSFPAKPLVGRDGQARAVVALPPGTPEAEQRGLIASYFRGRPADAYLPTPEELAFDVPVHGIAPRRACPVCRLPLPDLIDERDVYTIVVAGITAASKSTLLTRICRLTGRERGFGNLGFSEFVEMESSPATLDVLEQKVAQGGRLDRTDAPPGGSYEPWVFRVTGSRSRQERLLFLHDIAGESFQDPGARGRTVPFLGWADAVIFLVDPAPYLGLADPIVNQARVLEGTIRSVRNPNAAFAVALAKADLLKIGLNGSIGDGPFVQEALCRIGASAIVETASTRRGTTFHLVAAQPEAASCEPVGVAEVFSSVASRCQLI